MTGETQLTFGTPPSVLPLARAGRLKVIAVTSENRSALFPDLPTVAESGVPGYHFSFWWGLFGPAGLPQPIVQRLFEASKKVLADPALRERLASSGSEVATSESPTEFSRFVIKSGAEERELTLTSGAIGN